jgi:hypothetical protein
MLDLASIHGSNPRSPRRLHWVFQRDYADALLGEVLVEGFGWVLQNDRWGAVTASTASGEQAGRLLERPSACAANG